MDFPPYPTATHDNVMFDLETLSTRPNSAIVSIGAVLFDPHKALGDSFYCSVRRDGQEYLGLHVDPETEKWWGHRSEHARFALTDPEAMPLETALATLRRWLSAHDMTFRKEVHPWSHGAGFDLTILDSACLAVGTRPLFSFHSHRDTRTLYDLAGVDVATFRDAATAHNARDDAIAQAKAAQLALERIEGWRKGPRLEFKAGTFWERWLAR